MSIERKETEKIVQMYEKFGALFQLPTPPAEYIEALQEELNSADWTVERLQNALDYLKGDLEYNRMSRYNKYPTICDLMRADYDSRV